VTDASAIVWLALTAAVVAVAFVYSSVGHGGATGYLAVLALAGVAPDSARATALLMNCCVAGVAWWRFSRAGHFNLRVLFPLVATSVPCAWLGGRVALPLSTYSGLLGGVLVAAGFSLLPRRRLVDDAAPRPPSVGLALVMGASLGLLAGLSGIGGGVFLSPLLLFLRWVPVKTTGGTAAAFIVLNSLAGLAGLSARAAAVDGGLFALAVPAGAAALLGTSLGARRWSAFTFRRVLALVLVFAGGRLLWSAFP